MRVPTLKQLQTLPKEKLLEIGQQLTGKQLMNMDEQQLELLGVSKNDQRILSAGHDMIQKHIKSLEKELKKHNLKL